jgi:hypothetical protein
VPRRSKYTAADFPQPGTILAFPLADARFGTCRVVRIDTPEHSDALCALVILTEYIGSMSPRLEDPAVARRLLLNHHSWSNDPHVFWDDEPPPSSFQRVGIVPPDQEEATRDRIAFTSWNSLPLQRLLQWRWEYDREALLAEEALEKAEEEKRIRAEAERRAAILARTSLPSIQERKTLFPRWKEDVPIATIREIEEPIRVFIAAVIAMKNPTGRDITRELRVCAKALNKYDRENNHPIESIERDDIFELYEEILSVARHPDIIEKLDQWRDW